MRDSSGAKKRAQVRTSALAHRARTFARNLFTTTVRERVSTIFPGPIDRRLYEPHYTRLSLLYTHTYIHAQTAHDRDAGTAMHMYVHACEWCHIGAGARNAARAAWPNDETGIFIVPPSRSKAFCRGNPVCVSIIVAGFFLC